MKSLLWTILSVIMTVTVLSLDIVQSWVTTMYTVIVRVNVGFFSVMPAWLNFLIGTMVIVLLISVVR